MSETKVVVPEGMLEAAWCRRHGASLRDAPEAAISPIRETLEAAVRWLSEHPIVPTDEQWRKMDAEVTVQKGWTLHSLREFPETAVVEWQRRMFLAPQPEVPEAVKDLLCANATLDRAERNAVILEAYRRGRDQAQP